MLRIFRYNPDKTNKEWETEKNYVYRIYCKTAKAAGKQYTLTILPHFLLPGCLVRADDVFDTGIDENIRRDIEKACINMGVLDKRTANKHLARFDACLSDFLTNLASAISDSGEDLPNRSPEEVNAAFKNINWFQELALKMIRIREKLYGFENITGKEIASTLQFFNHSAYPAAIRKKISHQNASIFLKTPP